MNYISRVLELPQDLQAPMLRAFEAFEQEMRSQLAVRREDFAALQAVVEGLAEGQQRAEKRLDRLETVMVELAEAQRRTEQRVEELAEAQRRTEQRVEELAEAQRRTEQRVEELAEAQRRTEESLNKLIIRVDRIEVRLGGLIGDNLERKYRERAFAYLGQILRPVQSISLQDLLPELEAHLTEAEVDRLLPLDLLLRGRARHVETTPEVWLAMEVSAVVDQGDVERAVSRARLLTKAGFRAVPAVAGEEITGDASQLAIQQKVLVLQDGQRLNWQEALSTALG
jgi:hypothetical protein